MTLHTVPDNIYMDVLLLSLDNLIAQRLWSKNPWNRYQVTVLSKLDKVKLCTDIRAIDLSIKCTEELPLAKTLGSVWDTQNDSFRIVASLAPL